MKIKDLPRVDRPRERLIHYGPKRLSSSELLAIILGKGKKGENVLRLAEKTLRNFPNDNLLNASIQNLRTISGIGLAKACQLVACFELGKRLIKHAKTLEFISPKQVWQELRNIRDNKKEHFIAFYLDVRNVLIAKELISIGTLNTSLVHPREVFEPAIRRLAAQVILSHNHPSGDVTPSEEDIKITRQLSEAGKLLGIEIIDHVIVSSEDYLSFREKKLL